MDVVVKDALQRVDAVVILVKDDQEEEVEANVQVEDESKDEDVNEKVEEVDQ